MMKVLFSCLSRSWGGMEMYTINTILHLQKRGVEVDLVCYPGSRIHLEAEKLKIVNYSISAGWYFHPVQIVKLSRIISNGKYDIIHTHASKDLWVLVPSLRLKKISLPLILTKHVGSFIIKKDIFHKWIYKRLNYALAISKVIQQNLLDTCPLKNEQVILHYNGINLNKFNPAIAEGIKIRKEFLINDNDIVIGMVARFSPGKGHEEFLYAANELSKKFDNLKFMIVGEASMGEDKYASEIRQLSDKLFLKNLIFTGYRSDIPQVMAAFDIFVFPSHAEAFGIALIEAMALEKPTVCSNSDGVLDIAIDNVTSLLFQKGDWKDLLNKLEKLIVSPQLRLNLGVEGRKRVIENFDIELLANQLLNIYKTAIHK